VKEYKKIQKISRKDAKAQRKGRYKKVCEAGGLVGFLVSGMTSSVSFIHRKYFPANVCGKSFGASHLFAMPHHLLHLCAFASLREIFLSLVAAMPRSRLA
jgi:hypothetical protein